MNIDTSANKQKVMKDMENQMMLPMPFFAHMAMPLEVGSYDVRAALLPTQIDGKTSAEFNVQFTTVFLKRLACFLVLRELLMLLLRSHVSVFSMEK